MAYAPAILEGILALTDNPFCPMNHMSDDDKFKRLAFQFITQGESTAKSIELFEDLVGASPIHKLPTKYKNIRLINPGRRINIEAKLYEIRGRLIVKVKSIYLTRQLNYSGLRWVRIKQNGKVQDTKYNAKLIGTSINRSRYELREARTVGSVMKKGSPIDQLSELLGTLSLDDFHNDDEEESSDDDDSDLEVETCTCCCK